MLRRLLPLCCAPLLFAQSDAIQKMMNDSADAWNRGDLPTFASYYEDSPQTTFMGREIVRGGTQAILDRYRKSYPNRDAMGTLTFSEIVVRPLVTGLVLVTEMTGSVTLLLPMLGACFIAMLVPTLLRDPPIYDSLSIKQRNSVPP